MLIIFQIPFKLSLTVQSNRIVLLHTTYLEKPLTPQSAMGSQSHLCSGRWTSTHIKRSGGCVGTPCHLSLSLHFTPLLQVIAVCDRAGNGEEHVAAGCFCSLLLSFSQLTPALLVLPYHLYINLTFGADLLLLLQSSFQFSHSLSFQSSLN